MKFINNWRCVFISAGTWNYTLLNWAIREKSQVFLFSMRPGDHISGMYKRLFFLWIRDHPLIAELSVGSRLDFSQMRIIIFLIKGVRCHWLSEWGGDHSWWGQDGWCWAWKTGTPFSQRWAGVPRQGSFHTYPVTIFLLLLLPLPVCTPVFSSCSC